MSHTPSDLQELEKVLIRALGLVPVGTLRPGKYLTDGPYIDQAQLDEILAKVRGLVEAEVQAIPEVEIFIADNGNHVDASLRHHSHAVTAHKTNRLAKLQTKEGGERSE